MTVVLSLLQHGLLTSVSGVAPFGDDDPAAGREAIITGGFFLTALIIGCLAHFRHLAAETAMQALAIVSTMAAVAAEACGTPRLFWVVVTGAVMLVLWVNRMPQRSTCPLCSILGDTEHRVR